MVEGYHPQYQPKTPLSAREVIDNGRGFDTEGDDQTQCYNLFLTYSNLQFELFSLK